MRHPIAVAALLFGLGTNAGAEPAAASAPAPADAYASAGLVLDGYFLGWGVAGGYRVAGPVWAHGDLEHSPIVGAVAVRGGGELRGCAPASLCWIAGADIGVMAGHLGYQSGAAVAFAPHAGVELGGGAVRCRLEAEVIVNHLGSIGGLTASIVRRF